MSLKGQSNSCLFNAVRSNAIYCLVGFDLLTPSLPINGPTWSLLTFTTRRSYEAIQIPNRLRPACASRMFFNISPFDASELGALMHQLHTFLNPDFLELIVSRDFRALDTPSPSIFPARAPLLYFRESIVGSIASPES